MTHDVLDLEAALPAMHEVASRLTPGSWQHPGQVTWSARYALPEDLDHGPVGVFRVDGASVGWAWLESPGWVEWCIDPAHDGVAEQAVSWVLGATSTHTLDLTGLAPVPEVPGYAFRAVRPDEYDARAACHRASWSATSKVSGEAYRRLMATPPYRPALDWVAVTPDDEMVASCCVWLDVPTGVALVEPVGCHPELRRRGLASAVSLAALHAARGAGATTGLVRPRGDDDYPEPGRVYRGLGFVPGPRTHDWTLTRR